MTVEPRALVPAVGGEHEVPAPDPIARDYILLALRLDQHLPGLVDSFFGPAELKAGVDMEQRRSLVGLRDDTARLRDRVDTEIQEPERRRWLAAQVVALETQVAGLMGETIPYLDQVARCFELVPQRRDDAVFEQAAAALQELVPGDGPAADRLAAWDASLTVPADRIKPVADHLVERFRELGRLSFGLPAGESLRVSLVTGQPWGAFNWYDGGLRSRIDINTDLPTWAPDLPSLIGHETYLGHHLEQVWRESELVAERGLVEHTVMTLNTPECLISEGLAELGSQLALPREAEVELLLEVFELAGVGGGGGVTARETAERAAEIGAALRQLRAIDVNAALMRHVEGAGAERVESYLRDVGLMAPERATRKLAWIDHPMWRTYVFVYAEGEALLGSWLDQVPDGQRVARFGRLLHEALTPAAIRAEIEAGERGVA